MNKWRRIRLKSTILAIAIFAVFSNAIFHNAVAPIAAASDLIYMVSETSSLPTSKAHTLPSSLASWQDKTESGNYFKQVDSTPLGYLVWSKFPITVFIEQPLQTIQTNTANSAAGRRFDLWVSSVRQAIANWNVYLPLKETAEREQADIVVLRSQPARKAKLNSDTGLYDLPRAVTAETNYRFYLSQNPRQIRHKMTVEISPSYTGISLLATSRHELGHALGIWGHSSVASDALYFSQVSNPPSISPRDINTLKKIYQQPTKLGWKISRSDFNGKYASRLTKNTDNQ